MGEAKMHTDSHKAIVLHVAANLIDSLVQVLDEQGIETGELQLNMNGVPFAQMSPGDLAKAMRLIADEFQKVQVDTITHRTCGGQS